MNRKEMFDAFDMTEIDKCKKKYAQEVRQKYPQEIVEECERRTAGYDRTDCASIKEEGNRINRRLVELMDRDPADAEVQKLVAEWRQLINDRFYTCTPDILRGLRGLGDLYVADERFTAYYDKCKPGLAVFLRDVIHVYCNNVEA